MTAQTVSQAVATREQGPVTVMWSKRAHFRAVLPQSVDVEAFLGTAAGALYADDDLMKAARNHPDSLIVTLMKCAALGHMPGTDEFYLHIRKGKVTGTEGYRGVIERMYRSGAVAKVVVREVCASDRFRYVEGQDDKPVHEIGGRGTTGADFFGQDGSRNRGAMVGVYAYAELTTGAVSRVVIMDRDDVMAARESSDAKDSSYSPWNRLDGGKAHPELTGRSMWWKTAAKRLEPWVPTSAEYRREQLRASASAASLAAAPAAPANGNGHAPPPETVYDAEIVEDAPDVPGPETVTEKRRPLGKALLGRIKGLPLGEPADALATLAGLAGRELRMPEDLTADEGDRIWAAWEVALSDAEGETEDAAAALIAAGRLAQAERDGGA